MASVSAVPRSPDMGHMRRERQVVATVATDFLLLFCFVYACLRGFFREPKALTAFLFSIPFLATTMQRRNTTHGQMREEREEGSNNNKQQHHVLLELDAIKTFLYRFVFHFCLFSFVIITTPSPGWKMCISSFAFPSSSLRIVEDVSVAYQTQVFATTRTKRNIIERETIKERERMVVKSRSTGSPPPFFLLFF